MKIPWRYITLSLLACWAKGNIIVVNGLLGRGPSDPDDARFYADDFGFSATAMDEANARMKLTTRRWHHWTNYLVDWTRSDAQRAAKIACAAIGNLFLLSPIWLLI
jgi:hypothetical protein